MNAHTPFDAKKDWSNPYCQNSSNDQIVDALLGNAYHVVRTVYCNLGNLKLLYDLLNQYGMVLGVQSEAELKALTTESKYARIYGFSRAGDRQVTDYLYVEGDRTGILPDDTTATGSWVTVATSGSNSGGTSSGDGAYIPWVYNKGSAIGGETTINVPDGTVGVPFIIVNGDMQYIGRGFEFNVDSLSVTLAQPLEEGDEVVFLLTGVPAVPDNPNVNDWVQINWLYNNGAAVGGEQVIAIPYTFQSIPAVYKNGLRLYKGLATESYTADPDNQRIFLTEPLTTNDRLIVQIGGEAQVLEASDHTLQEVARAANVKDTEVILSTDTTQVLNGKKIIYDVVTQRIYGLPTLPTNVYINSVSNGQLTYSPGNVSVSLLPMPGSATELKSNLGANDGYRWVGKCNTIDELRAVIPTTNGQTILLNGYYSDMPYVEAVTYQWNSSATNTDDGGRYIKPNSLVTGRWVLKHNSNTYDVRLFGAKPNPTYSASQMDVQDIILKAQASIGVNGVLHFPLPNGWFEAHYLIDVAGFDWTPSLISADTGVVIHSPFTNDSIGKKPRLASTVKFSELAPSAPNNYQTERGSNNYDIKSSIASAMSVGLSALNRKWERIDFTQYSRPVKYDNLNLTFSDYTTGITVQGDQIFYSDAAAAGSSWQGVEFAAQVGSDIELLAENTGGATSGVVIIGVRCMTSSGTGTLVNMRLTISSDEVKVYNADILAKSVTVYHPSEIINTTNGVRIGVRIVDTKNITFMVNGKPFADFTTGSTFVHSIAVLADQAARSGIRFKYGVSHIRDYIQYTLPLDLMIMGDSTSVGARSSNEWCELLRNYGEHLPGIGRIRRVTNTAISGRRLSDYIADLPKYNFAGYSHVLVCLGTNDCQATGTAGVGVFATNLQTLITAIKNGGAVPVIGMFPKYTAASLTGNGNEPTNMDDIPVFQEVIRYICGNNNVQVAFVDDHFGDNYGYLNSFAVGGQSDSWYQDNIHPGTRGHMAYAAAFAEALSRSIVRPSKGSITKRLIPQGAFTNHTDSNIVGELRVTRVNNTITISGAIAGGTNGTGGTIASLPTWAIPTNTKYFTTETHTGTAWTPCRVSVNNAGLLQIDNRYGATRTDLQITYNI